MPEPLRVGVIGVGAMGAHHVRVYGELGDAQLVAVADSDEARLAAVTPVASMRAYTDYRTMLVEERLDAVSVAVPSRLHLDVGLACIESGVPVLVEKPLAADLGECVQLRNAAAAAAVPLMVGHIERFNPAVVELKRLLDSGTLGRVVQMTARRVGPFYERQRDVGVVHDLATHDIDVLHDLIGCDVNRLQAETQKGIKTDNEDAVAAVLRFENGVVATLDVNWVSPVKVRELTVLAERGTARVDYITQDLVVYEFGLDDGAPRTAASPRKIEVQRREPLRAELESFLQVARGLEEPRVGPADAIAAMHVVEALVESARRGEPMAVPAGGPR